MFVVMLLLLPVLLLKVEGVSEVVFKFTDSGLVKAPEIVRVLGPKD